MSLNILSVIFLLCSIILISEDKLAIINDKEGFTIVYSGQGLKYKAIDTLFYGDFFDFQYIDNSEWVRVSAWKGRQIKGFIHKSKILEVEKLDKERQKELIIETFNNHIILAEKLQNFIKYKYSESKNAIIELEYHSETKYDPILTILPKYFCSTKNVEVLQLFFATMWADKSSANELPLFSIGKCCICNPDLVFEQMSKIDNNEQKAFIIDNIEWGLLNIFHVDEKGNSEDKEFNILKARLDKERMKTNK